MRLSPREYLFISIGAFLVLGTVFWLAVYEPVTKKIDLMDRQTTLQSKRYEEMTKLIRGYSGLKEKLAGVESRLRRTKGFSILSHLENMAARMDVKDRIVQMKPKQGQTTRFYKEGVVEIKMEKVNLQTLVNYLYQVENSPELLQVKDLKIKPRYDNPNLVDAIFQVSAFENAETAP